MISRTACGYVIKFLTIPFYKTKPTLISWKAHMNLIISSKQTELKDP